MKKASLLPRKGQVKKALFAQYLSKGYTQTRSAILSGYSKYTANQIGYTLAHDPYVLEQLAHIQKRMEQAQVIDITSHLQELAMLRDKASELGQMGPAVAAEVSRGKVGKLYVEQVEDVTKRHRLPSEIMDDIMSRMKLVEGGSVVIDQPQSGGESPSST